MQPKLLTINDFIEYFKFQENETGCGIEQEPESRENYFWAQTFLPKDYFDLDHPSISFNPMIRQLLRYVPEQIHIKFELFAIGNLDDKEAFVFKPWVLNIDNPMLFGLFEGFHLFIPSTLFYNLIDRLIFLEQINPATFQFIRILQDLPPNAFECFGLNKANVPININSGKLEIRKIGDDNRDEIKKFYSEHGDGISSHLENKYFRPLLNNWYRITCEQEGINWLALKKSTVVKTIGYLRLYNTNSSFTGGMLIEYIIAKEFRNNGYATQASSALISHLKKYSYALNIGAEVDEDNEFSIKVLRRLGFKENKVGPFLNDNFTLILHDDLIEMENYCENGVVEFSVINKYAEKYSRYF